MKTYKLLINGEKFDTRVLEYSGTHAKISVNGHEYHIQIEQDAPSMVPKIGSQDKAVPLAPAFSSGVDSSSGEIKAPIPGVIASISVKEGDSVKKGQTLLILEAMKMESEIAAPVDGKIVKITIKERSPVHEGDVLMIIENTEILDKQAAKPSKRVQLPKPEPVQFAAQDNTVRAPIPGVIVDVLVKPGDMVDENTVIIILEAMKMESEIHCTMRGRVMNVFVNKGDMVQEEEPLIELET